MDTFWLEWEIPHTNIMLSKNNSFHICYIAKSSNFQNAFQCRFFFLLLFELKRNSKYLVIYLDKINLGSSTIHKKLNEYFYIKIKIITELYSSWQPWRIYLFISGNFKCSKKADNILEMAGLRLFCDYCFINHICKIRLLSRLINCKLIRGVSDLIKIHSDQLWRIYGLWIFRPTRIRYTPLLTYAKSAILHTYLATSTWFYSC